jgi:hypothetical protein
MSVKPTAAPAPAAAESSPSAPEPPIVYYLACGAQCDVFWWARRSPDRERAAAPAATARDGGTPKTET